MTTTTSPDGSGTHPRPLRAVVVALLCGVLAALAGCGGSSSTVDDAGTSASPAATTTTAEAAAPLPDTSLDIASPDDGQVVHSKRVRFRGTTSPQARLTLDGDEVDVEDDGSWSVRRSLELGSTSFTVTATQDGHEPASESFEVERRRTAAQRRAIAAAKARRKAEAAAARKAKREQAEATFRASARTIAYNQLNKDADRYEGDHVVYRGQILQIQEDGDAGGIMLVSVTDEGYGIWDDNIWVDYDSSVPYAEEDVVRIYGTVTGSKSYETQVGGETYVPQIKAKFVEAG